MKAKKIVIVPETHWDREWYLTFQEYRARLVIMMDKLLHILESDPNFKNFTLDGQTIPLEDYLEVKPHREADLRKYIKEGRLSVGPFYILPDEFLISGESMIRNIIIGDQIAQKFGRVMKAGYIPDPFGHIAQLPQILSGSNIPSVLFARGFGDEFTDLGLNVEFEWQAPGNAASIMGIHLIEGYGSVANLNTTKKNGRYVMALKKIRRIISKMEQHTASPVVILNNGSDHLEAQPELPEIIEQWNSAHPDKILENQDFEYYVNRVKEANPILKTFQGELRGGKYNNLLSGVLSTRMWIKQRNTAIEYLYEKFSEPASTMAWLFDKTGYFEYPKDYLLTGYKWLIKNHPHDSICGCSIDQVHSEMRTRFDWSEQIGEEIFKDAMINISNNIEEEENPLEKMRLIVYNPLPWPRKDVVKFYVGTLPNEETTQYPDDLRIIDANGKEIECQNIKVPPIPRFRQVFMDTYLFSFIAEIPACGYKVYYVDSYNKANSFKKNSNQFILHDKSIENEYYKVNIDDKGKIDVINKESQKVYENVCQFEDVGDWGDEYDYSGPKSDQIDCKILSKDAINVKISEYNNGPSQKSLRVDYIFNLPKALTKDRSQRQEDLIENEISVIVTLYKGINRIDFKIRLENQSRDHRIRALFSSNIKSEQVYADGHFYVVPRNVDIPKVKKWAQDPLPTNHQKDFIAVHDSLTCVAVLNRGLPEYEAIEEMDGTITLAITLLRCIEWLSRADIATRKGNAGPDLNTPGAQEIGTHIFELSLVIENDKKDCIDAEIHVKGKEFNNPLRALSPIMAKSQFRIPDKLILTPIAAMLLAKEAKIREIKGYLPPELSFLEIDNNKVVLSIIKRAENGIDLILRLYNITSEYQSAQLKLSNELSIDKVEIVNLLEEKPQNLIKASAEKVNHHIINVSLEPHVIATLRIKIGLIVL
ncbi:MAG: alpha-mannosidase [Promethearchaeota archaeon]